MRIVIVNCNREKSPQALLPIGACAVSAAVEAAGHETHLLDLCFTRKPVRALRMVVQRLRPDVIGLSLRNLDNCDAARPVSYLSDARALVAACRQVGEPVIVLGGAAVSLAPATILREVGGDYAVSGEGEVAFPALLSALERGRDPAAIPGVTTRAGQYSAPRTIAQLDMLPVVDYTRWLAIQRYTAHDATYPVQTKRGCAFQCSYCTYPLLEGHNWRLRPPESVAEEVQRASDTGLRMVEFVDSVFGLPAAHAIACCEAISRRKPTLPLCTMDLSPLACTPDLVQAMSAAGFTAVGITAESGANAMLGSMRKGFHIEHLHQAANTLQALPAARLWIFMMGMPGECEATVRETARFIAGLPSTDLVLVTLGVRVLPGTALHAELIARGEASPEETLLQPRFYYSPYISPERTQSILEESRGAGLRMVTLHDGGHRLLPTIQRLMAQLGMQPPYWRHLPWLNRIRRVLHQ